MVEQRGDALTKLDLWSERYQPSGSMAAGGISKLLGRSDLDLLEVLVREAGQNVWDAREPMSSSPEFRIRVRSFTPAQMQVLREEVYCELPPRCGGEFPASLKNFLKQERGEVLELSDFGTRGLGGPTDASREPEAGEVTDFVDLIRNIGSHRDVHLGGGTYGYGKASLYGVSSCRTVLFDSQVKDGGEAQRRLISAALGGTFTRNGRKYTGRHWWGTQVDETRLDPITGTEAKTLSSALGFFDRGPSVSGTTIAILGPDWEQLLGGNDGLENLDSMGLRERAAERIVEILLVNFWPKMLKAPDGSAPAMNFKVIREEALDEPIPPPELCPPLDLYAEAWRRVRRQLQRDPGHSASELEPGVHEIRQKRPKRHTGWLGIAKRTELPHPGGKPMSSGLRLVSESGEVYHVAFMRPAELVVCYEAGWRPERDETEWAGVFIADSAREVEEAFAESEPPAHNLWSPKDMPPEKAAEKKIVNVSLREIRKVMRAQISDIDSRERTEMAGDVPLAEASSMLGRFLYDTPETVGGPGPRRRSVGGGSGQTSLLGPLEALGLEFFQGKRAARFRAKIRRDARNISVSCRSQVVLEGAVQDETPDGDRSEVLAWVVKGAEADGQTRLELEQCEAGTSLEVVVSVPDEYAIRASLEADEAAAP